MAVRGIWSTGRQVSKGCSILKRKTKLLWSHRQNSRFVTKSNHSIRFQLNRTEPPNTPWTQMQRLDLRWCKRIRLGMVKTDRNKQGTNKHRWTELLLHTGDKHYTNNTKEKTGCDWGWSRIINVHPLQGTTPGIPPGCGGGWSDSGLGTSGSGLASSGSGTGLGRSGTGARQLRLGNRARQLRLGNRASQLRLRNRGGERG